jgi:coproporphyrinogen III oxidase-like Fe-S oxidoreductase
MTSAAERLEQWKSIGITRLSIGTQSFREDRLRSWAARTMPSKP